MAILINGESEERMEGRRSNVAGSVGDAATSAAA